MKTLKEKIEIMQAALEGKVIEIYDTLGWDLCSSKPETIIFDWFSFDYRIKKEPLELYVNMYRKDYYAHSTRERALERKAEGCIRSAIKMVEA